MNFYFVLFACFALLSVSASPTAPSAPPSETPSAAPTSPPTAPSSPPSAPTGTPMAPTEPPTAPSTPPSPPSSTPSTSPSSTTPSAPSETPMAPSGSPSAPSAAPTVPSESPTAPSSPTSPSAPTAPSMAPTPSAPSETPTAPSESPSSNTPTSPSMGPSSAPTPPGPQPTDREISCSITIHNFIPTTKQVDVRCAYDPTDKTNYEAEAEQIEYANGATFDTDKFPANKPPYCSVVQTGSPDPSSPQWFEHVIDFTKLNLGNVGGDDGKDCNIALVLIPGQGCLDTCKQIKDPTDCTANKDVGCKDNAGACELDCGMRIGKETCEIDNLCNFNTTLTPAVCTAPPAKDSNDAPTGGNLLWVNSMLQAYRVELPVGDDDNNIAVRAAQLIPDLACNQNAKDPARYGRLMNEVRVTISGDTVPNPPSGAPSAAPSAAPSEAPSVAPSSEAPSALNTARHLLQTLGGTFASHLFGPNGDGTIGVDEMPYTITEGTIKVSMAYCEQNCGVPESFTTPDNLKDIEIPAGQLDSGSATLVAGYGALNGLGTGYSAEIGATPDAQPATNAFQEPWPYIIIGIGVIVVLAIIGYFIYKKQQPKEDEAKPLLG